MATPPRLATRAGDLRGVPLGALRAGRDRRASRAHRRSRQHLAAELDERGIDRVQNWLVRGPFHLSRRDVKKDFDNLASRSSRTQEVSPSVAPPS